MKPESINRNTLMGQHPLRPSGLSQELVKNFALYTMLLPGLIFLIVFAYAPMAGAVIAFKDYRISGPNFVENLLSSPWVGLNNFRFLFLTPSAWNMTKNTVLYNLVFMILQTILPIAVAIGLNELRGRRKAVIYQGIFFVAFFLSWVTVSYFVYSLLNSQYGLVNSIIKAFGGQPVTWYTEPKYWPLIIILAHIWKSTGPNTVIWLAGIAGISPELYDAAAIDGASKWQQIKHITLPSLMPLIIILNLLALGRIFGADFGLFFTLPMNSGPLTRVTEVIDVYVYRSLTQAMNIGMTAAAGLYQSVVGFILVLAANMIVKRIDEDRALF